MKYEGKLNLAYIDILTIQLFFPQIVITVLILINIYKDICKQNK